MLILRMRTPRPSEAMIVYKMAPNLFVHCLGRCPPTLAQGTFLANKTEASIMLTES